MTGRYVVVGVAGARSSWFADLTRWSTSGLIAAEYVKALSTDEVRAIFAAGRKVSALLIGSSTPGLDRELVALSASVGTAVIVVADRSPQRDWDSLGIAATLPADFGPDLLIETLSRHAKRIDPAVRRSSQIAVSLRDDQLLGPLIAVTGAGGAGVSTISMGLAQGLANGTPERTTALADLSRQSDLAMYHDVGDIIPGLPELVDSHRGDSPDPEKIRELLFHIPERSYSLLLGQRRPRDSAAMGPLSTAAAIDGLRRSYGLVVTDVEATVDGESETGSLDIELFNAAPRHALSVASLVLVVGEPGMRGARRISHLVATLERFGIPPRRIVPVINNAPRSAAGRAAITRLVSEINPVAEPIQPPLFVRRSRFLEDVHHSGGRLPSQLAEPLARSVQALLLSVGNRKTDIPRRAEPLNVDTQRAQVA